MHGHLNVKGRKVSCLIYEFLILSFRRVLYVICFLLGNSPTSESNSRRFGTLYQFHLHRQVDEVYETSCGFFLHKIQCSYLQTFLSFSTIRISQVCISHGSCVFPSIKITSVCVFFKPGLNVIGQTPRFTQNPQPRYVSADVFNVYTGLCQVIKWPVSS